MERTAPSKTTDRLSSVSLLVSVAALTDDGMIRLFIDLFAQPQSPALVFLTLA